MNIGTMEDGRNRLKKKSLPSVKWSPPSILARSALHIQPLHVLITLFRSVRVQTNQVAFHRVGLKRLQKNSVYRNVELCKRVYNYHGASFQLDKLHGSLLLLGNCGGENGSKKLAVATELAESLRWEERKHVFCNRDPLHRKTGGTAISKLLLLGKHNQQTLQSSACSSRNSSFPPRGWQS